MCDAGSPKHMQSGRHDGADWDRTLNPNPNPSPSPNQAVVRGCRRLVELLLGGCHRLSSPNPSPLTPHPSP